MIMWLMNPLSNLKRILMKNIFKKYRKPAILILSHIVVLYIGIEVGLTIMIIILIK